MRTLYLIALALLVGCSAAAEPSDTPTDAALHGTSPEQPLGLPDFAVADQLGQPRGPADLKGRPHVLWFYPMAGTPG
jgi:cytochrome oxidase Cu insertion factor (SCO1/SenC/PrrC family)